MKNRSTLPLHEAWVIFFFLGVVMLNYPFLHIFNKEILIFGVPLLIVYLMVGWPLSIVVVYFFSVSMAKEQRTDQETLESEARPEDKK